MKKIVTVVLFLLFATSVTSFAKTDAVYSSVASFEGGAVNSVLNGTYNVENAEVREQFFVEGEREINYAYGKFGKNADDASLAVKFNQLEFTYDANYQRDPGWAQCRVINKLDTPQKVELGQKIHYSMLETDENSKVGMRMKVLGTCSSGKNIGGFYYKHISPNGYSDQWNGSGDSLFAKYGGGVYIADASSGIRGAKETPNEWHRYDIVIDTQDESQGGVQTVKLYYDGDLYSYAILDCDKSTDGVQYIREITGFGVEILPTIRKVSGTENRYTCAGDTEYIDDISVTVLNETEEPEILVNGKKYSGSYRRGDTAVFYAPFPKEFPMAEATYNTGKNTRYNVFYPDSDGNITAQLGNGKEETKLFLWQQKTFEPLTKPYTFVPYEPEEQSYIDFDSNSEYTKLNTVLSSTTSFVGGTIDSVLNGTYKVENTEVKEQFFVEGEREIDYAYGKFGKDADDAALAVKFNQLEFTYDANYQRDPGWAQYKVINNPDAPQKIELGQKIHYSLLEADENSKVGMRMKLFGTNSSGKSLGKFHYTHIEPGQCSNQWNCLGDTLIMKYVGGVYIADASSGIRGAKETPNEWHRYDIVIDTQDESQGGVQTVKLYYDGDLYSYAILDCDKDTDGVQYIREITGFGVEILPTIRKVSGTENQYTCAGDTEYIDDMTLTVLEKGDTVGVSAEIGDAVPGAASGVTGGLLGKSDNFFYVSNDSGSVSTDDVSRLETAVTADIKTEYNKDESLWLSFEYGYKSNAYPKSIYVKPKNGLMRELAVISADGGVRIGRVPCSNIKMLPNQWYRFDVVLNSGLRDNYNTATVYINGIKCAENFPIYLGETSLKGDNFIESLKIAYNLSSSDTAEADGIYLDNIKVQLCNRFLPDITEYKVKSSDTIYNMITDSTNFTIAQYGQNTESYIGTLKGIKLAVFVSANGTETTELPSAGEGYLRVTAEGGYNVYYSLTEGTDDRIRESIDPVENDYNPNTDNWYAYTAPDLNVITEDGNILNVAAKNPVKAGSLGVMSTSGENFTAGGTPIHFWGCNVITSACTPTNEQADKMADMIASYGFNLVRLHMLTADSRTMIFGANGDGQTLNTEMMNRFCYFVNKLNEKGIYIYIDLGRQISDKDISDGLIEKKPTSGNQVFWFDEDYQKIQIDCAKQLLTYVDPYTNKRVCDNNSIMGVQCVNEAYIYGDLFENALGFDSEEYQYYYAKMNEKFDAWYRETYPDYKTEVTKIGLSREEANGELITIGSRVQRGFVQVNGGWGSYPWMYSKRQENLIRFFNEMQSAYFAKMQNMFDENKINVPMTGSTVWHSNDLALLDANLDTKFIDTHTYWGHPLNGFSAETGKQFPGGEMQSMLKSSSLGIIGYIMNRKPYDKPYTISEWNECANNQYMSESPLIMAAYSKYQNWNPMLFMFMEEPMTDYKNTHIVNVFQMADNPIMLSTMQAATLTWRNVSEAEKNCYMDYSDTKSYEYTKHHHEYYDKATGSWKPAENQWSGYDIITKKPTLGMLAKTGASVRVKPENDDISAEKEKAMESGVYTSDTGEITFDSNKNTFTVNTAKSKAATGFFKDETSIGDVLKFRFDNEFATVYVNSVTDSDISSSDRLLLTVAGKAVNTDQVLQRSGSPYVIRGGKAPVLMEQITGTVKIKTDSAMKVYSLTASGERKNQISASYNDGWLTVPLSLSDECVNYEIVK